MIVIMGAKMLQNWKASLAGAKETQRHQWEEAFCSHSHVPLFSLSMCSENLLLPKVNILQSWALSKHWKEFWNCAPASPGSKSDTKKRKHSSTQGGKRNTFPSLFSNLDISCQAPFLIQPWMSGLLHPQSWTWLVFAWETLWNLHVVPIHSLPTGNSFYSHQTPRRQYQLSLTCRNCQFAEDPAQKNHQDLKRFNQVSAWETPLLTICPCRNKLASQVCPQTQLNAIC